MIYMIRIIIFRFKIRWYLEDIIVRVLVKVLSFLFILFWWVLMRKKNFYNFRMNIYFLRLVRVVFLFVCELLFSVVFVVKSLRFGDEYDFRWIVF